MKSMTFGKIVIATILAMISSVCLAFGTGNMPSVPAGWTLKEAGINVRVYQKGTEQVYAQVVDIKGGGKIRFIQTVSSNVGNKTFTRQTLDQWWSSYSGSKVTMINGQFFDNAVTPTPFSFGVRANGSLLTYGSDTSVVPKKQVEFYDNTGVLVTSWNNARLNGGSSAQNIIVGLDPSFDKQSGWSIGRTYVCSKVNPVGPTSPSQWFVIVSAQGSTQPGILANINSWGCDAGSVVMFDGSGSTQFKTAAGIRMNGYGAPFWTENRPIPQTLAISNN